MTIHLPDEIEHALADEARRRGTTPELLAIHYLRQHLGGRAEVLANTAPANLAELLSGHIGVLASAHRTSGSLDAPEQPASEFARALQDKRRRKRL